MHLRSSTKNHFTSRILFNSHKSNYAKVRSKLISAWFGFNGIQFQLDPLGQIYSRIFHFGLTQNFPLFPGQSRLIPLHPVYKSLRQKSNFLRIKSRNFPLFPSLLAITSLIKYKVKSPQTVTNLFYLHNAVTNHLSSNLFHSQFLLISSSFKYFLDYTDIYYS